MQDPRNLSWTQFNQSRKFPLLFGCTAVSTCGHFRIPDDLLVSLYLSYGVNTEFSDPGGFYIGRIIYWRDGISLEIHYDAKKVAETTIPLTGHVREFQSLGVTSSGVGSAGDGISEIPPNPDELKIRPDGLLHQDNVLYAFCGATGPEITAERKQSIQVRNDVDANTVSIAVSSLNGKGC